MTCHFCLINMKPEPLISLALRLETAGPHVITKKPKIYVKIVKCSCWNFKLFLRGIKMLTSGYIVLKIIHTHKMEREQLVLLSKACAHPHMPARTDTDQHTHPQTFSRNILPLTRPNYGTVHYIQGQGKLSC